MTIAQVYPFKCVVTGDHIKVYAGDADDALVATFDGHVWIGKDPNEPDNDGNTILVVHTNGSVTFIGKSIYTFQPHRALVTYVSEMPYPYAIDQEDNYYFFEEHTVVRGAHITNKVDPYSHQGGLYGLMDMTGFEDVVVYSVGASEYSYTMMWKPLVEHEFRMYDDDAYERYLGDAEYIVVVKSGGLRENMTRSQLQQLYDRYAERYGMHDINNVDR
jgi:hypothetical protein